MKTCASLGSGRAERRNARSSEFRWCGTPTHRCGWPPRTGFTAGSNGPSGTLRDNVRAIPPQPAAVAVVQASTRALAPCSENHRSAPAFADVLRALRRRRMGIVGDVSNDSDDRRAQITPFAWTCRRNQNADAADSTAMALPADSTGRIAMHPQFAESACGRSTSSSDPTSGSPKPASSEAPPAPAATARP